jgi:hypothetical protein
MLIKDPSDNRPQILARLYKWIYGLADYNKPQNIASIKKKNIIYKYIK